MSFTEILPYIITGFSVAGLHAALPTHWLPFVLAGKTQKWSYSKTMGILLIAGTGHILTTSVIGAGIVWFGISMGPSLQSILTLGASLSLFLFGLYYIIQYKRGFRHAHCDHAHPHSHDFTATSKDGWAVLSLLTVLTLSPCESFIPIYASAWTLGWMGFFWLSVVLALGTLISMGIFTTLAFLGVNRFRFDWLEKHEKLVMGVILMLFSVVIFFIESGHQHAHALP